MMFDPCLYCDCKGAERDKCRRFNDVVELVTVGSLLLMAVAMVVFIVILPIMIRMANGG